MEYALDLDPKKNDAEGLPVPGVLPSPYPCLKLGTLTFRRWAGFSGLSYKVQEYSSGDWSNIAPNSYTVVSSDGVHETVVAKLDPVGGARPRKLMRLQVIQTP
jgi:hypothetical protein